MSNADLNTLAKRATQLANELTSLASTSMIRDEAADAVANVANGIDFYDVIATFETLLITTALTATRGNQRRAAKLLNLKTTTLNSLINRYKIEAKASEYSTQQAGKSGAPGHPSA